MPTDPEFCLRSLSITHSRQLPHTLELTVHLKAVSHPGATSLYSKVQSSKIQDQHGEGRLGMHLYSSRLRKHIKKKKIDTEVQTIKEKTDQFINITNFCPSKNSIKRRKLQMRKMTSKMARIYGKIGDRLR